MSKLLIENGRRKSTVNENNGSRLWSKNIKCLSSYY